MNSAQAIRPAPATNQRGFARLKPAAMATAARKVRAAASTLVTRPHSINSYDPPDHHQPRMQRWQARPTGAIQSGNPARRAMPRNPSAGSTKTTATAQVWTIGIDI